jgi:4-amino-4-deoxy-L-arabinose transferase-like glycosyltransferase
LYGETAGLLAAFVYAILPLAVVNAHFYTVDVTATLFVALTLLSSARIIDSQSWQNYALAGLWTGLAAATKYSTALVIVAPVAAHLLVSSHSARKKTELTSLAVLFAASVITFLAACPGPLINWSEFWDGIPGYAGSGVRYQLLEHPHMGHGLLFVNTGPGWWYHLVVSLRYGLGLPMLVLVCAGIVVAVHKRGRSDQLLLWFTLIFYGVTGLSGVRFARYMIPLYPAFCVLAARLVIELKPNSRNSRLWKAAISQVILFTACYTGSLIEAMAGKDPRDVAADYMEAHAKPGATVAFAKTPWFFTPPLSPWFGAKAASTRAKCIESTRYRFVLPAKDTEFDVGVLTPPPDYLIISNIESINENRLNQPAPQRFLASIPGDYKQTVFAPPHIFNMTFASLSTGLVPDDLLYILPRVTVYEKR